VTAENHELTRQQRDIAKSYQKLRQTSVNRRRLLVNAGIAAGLIGAYRMGPETPVAGAAVRARQDAVAADHPAILAAQEWVGAPEEPTEPITLVDWEEAGERWELPKRGVYPIWQMIHPNVMLEIQATPIGEMFPKIQLAMASKSDKYDIIDHDYAFFPQLISAGHLTQVQDYLDVDEAYKEDIYSDVPENILDLYRDKPLAEGGVLYGLPPDGNCQLMVYRRDAFEAAGITELPQTWPEAIEVAKELTSGNQYGFTATLRRGYWATHCFNTIFWSHGGEWFGNGYNEPPTLNVEAGVMALETLLALMPYAAPGTLNAVDDEANALITTGSAVFAPNLWGGSVWTNQKTNPQFYDKIGVDIVPKGTTPESDHRPIMGGLGLFIPAYSHNKDWAWQWIKFCASKEVGKEWVENLGQPARLSLLTEYESIQPYFPALAKSFPTAHRMEPIPETGELYEVFGTEVANVTTGAKAPEQALADANKAVEDIMRNAGYYN
jgi:ABC-type glycerol-3-phosphate transport system substrate-binding protein